MNQTCSLGGVSEGVSEVSGACLRVLGVQSRYFYGDLVTGSLGRFGLKSRKIWLEIHPLMSHFAKNV